MLYMSFLKGSGVMVIQHHHKTTFDFPCGVRVKEKKIGENQLTFVELEEK